MIKVLNNIIPKNWQDEIEQELLSWNFPWYHYANTNYADKKTRADDVPQFTHGFIRDNSRNSAYEKLPRAILHNIGIEQTTILRAKANLLTWEPKPFTHPPHIDEKERHYALIYYVNDSDGDTKFYREGQIFESISPKKGNAVLFDGAIYHASSSPVENRFRIVINYNLRQSDYLTGILNGEPINILQT